MKKQKFLTLFSILALCVCSLFIGVWAAKTATVTTGGSINFTATGVNCKVSGAIQNSTASLKTLDTLTFSASDESSTKSWGTSNAIAFDNNETPINIVITVENLVDRALYAKVTDAVFGDGSQFTVTLSTELLELATTGTDTITITITPKPMDVSVTKDYSFNVVLTAEKPAIEIIPEASSLTNLSLAKVTGETANGLQAVSVAPATTLASGTYEIPEYVKIDGEKCVVTTVEDNAFANCTDVTIVLPNTITSIGASAFEGADVDVHIYSETCTFDEGWDESFYGSVFLYSDLIIYQSLNDVGDCDFELYIEESCDKSWADEISNGFIISDFPYCNSLGTQVIDGVTYYKYHIYITTTIVPPEPEL